MGQLQVLGSSLTVVGNPATDAAGIYSPAINANNNALGGGLVVVTIANNLIIGIRSKSGGIPGISGLTLVNQIAGQNSNAFEIYAVQDVPLVFGTNNAERARLTSIGFGIGKTAEAKLDVDGEIRGSFVNATSSMTTSTMNADASYSIAGETAFSSVPVHHAGGFNSTLGAGTTFYAFIPDSAIRLTRITVTVVVAGIGGSGDQFFCSDGTNALSVTVAAAALAGTVTSSQGAVLVAAGDTVNYRMESDAGITPTVNIDCQYEIQ